MQLNLRQIQKVQRSIFKVLLMDGMVISGACALVFFFRLRDLFPGVTRTEIMSSTAVLAITAAISSPTIVTVLSHMLPSRGRFTSTVRLTTSLSAVIPLFAFGLFFTIVHPGFFVTHGFLSGFLWWLFANVVGVVMGLVFVLLTMQRVSRDERLLVIMGTVIFVAGICYFLNLSALYTAMIMGIVAGNFSRRRVRMFEQLLSLEKVIYIAFLIVIGGMVQFTGAVFVFALASYVVLRLGLKIIVSSWALASAFAEFAPMKAHSGFALSAQGAMALAVALDYGLGTTGQLVDTVVAVIACAVVLNEFIGVFLTRRAFQVAGDVKERRTTMTAPRR
jgi:Kef-type K+ transport system membrane component KefB